MEKNKFFILIVVFWIILIVGLIGMKEFTLRTGKQVRLKTVPVDPRDLFRGDYIILSYKISRFNLNQIQADSDDITTLDKVYVALKEEDGFAVPTKIYKSFPKDEELFIKGKVSSSGSDKRITVDYGIESYFVPEGKGKEIEKDRGRGLNVKLSIDKYGNAAIRALFLDDKKVSFR